MWHELDSVSIIKWERKDDDFHNYMNLIWFNRKIVFYILLVVLAFSFLISWIWILSPASVLSSWVLVLPSLESQLDFRSLCVRIFLCSSFLGPAQCRTREILDLAPGWSRSGALIREQGSPVQASTLPQPIRFLRSPDFQSPLAPRWSVSGFWTTRRSAQLVLPAERAASFEFSCRRPSFSFPAHRFGLRAQGTSTVFCRVSVPVTNRVFRSTPSVPVHSLLAAMS
jgi:hypothetical protein